MPPEPLPNAASPLPPGAERLKQAVLDAATEVSIIATDPWGVINVFNRGAEKMLGYAAHEVIGKKTPLLFHLPSEIARQEAALTAQWGRPVTGFEIFTAIAGQAASQRREWTYRHRDGHRIVVDMVLSAERDDAGAIIGYLGIALDISGRKRAENALEKQREFLQTIIDGIPGGISLIDADLRFIAANDELYRLLDLPRSLFVNGPPTLYELALFNARRGEYGPGVPEELARVVAERDTQQVAHCFQRTRPNGVTLEVRGTPLAGGGFVTIYTDVTERQAAEAELMRHRDHLQELVNEHTAKLKDALYRAEAAARAKTEFLANMSHELRTPMHAILSFSDMGRDMAQNMAQEPGAEKWGHYFRRIHQSAERLLELINNLLSLSRLESGAATMHWATADLAELVERVGHDLESLIERRDLRLTVEKNGVSAAILCDARQITQVIHNLFANAIKFTPPGGDLQVSFQAAELPPENGAHYEGAPRPAIRLIVADSGIGIPPGELESIFDKFAQSSKTRTGTGGTGLGLAICREIVTAHRGTIHAMNNLAGGASLIVTLPLDHCLEKE